MQGTSWHHSAFNERSGTELRAKYDFEREKIAKLSNKGIFIIL